eukprot:381-Heterococcus_DN1.PRE.1
MLPPIAAARWIPSPRSQCCSEYSQASRGSAPAAAAPFVDANERRIPSWNAACRVGMSAYSPAA